MSVETATYINQLQQTLPLDTDPAEEGSAHIRLIKQVLVNNLNSFGTALVSAPGVLDAAANYVTALTNAGVTASQIVTLLQGLTVTPSQINAVAGALAGAVLTVPAGTGAGAGGRVTLMPASGYNEIQIWNQNGTLQIVQINPSTGNVSTIATFSSTGLLVNGTVHGSNV